MGQRPAAGRIAGVLALLALLSSTAIPQDTSSAWIGQPPIVESVAAITARGRATPPPSSPILKSRPRLRAPSSGIQGPATPSAASSVPAGPLISGPALPQTVGTSFLGAQSSETIWQPPDTMGSVGPTQIVVIINGRIKLFDRSGNLDTTVLNIDTNSFFTSVLESGTNSSDCRIRYDRDSQRWYVVMIDTASANNRVMIAVSNKSTISATDYFSFYQFNQNVVTPTGDNGLFADYPTLGIDHNALYIGTNMFGANYAGSTGFVVQKASLTSGGPIVATALRGIANSNQAGAYTPQGVDNDDPSASTGFFVGIDNSTIPSTGSSTRMVAIRVANPGSVSPAPSIDATISITVPAFGFAMGGVLTKGNSHPVDDVDNRLMMGQMKNGSLWTVHAIQVDSSGTENSSGGRDGARWYEITGLQASPPAPAVHQSGTLFDSSASNPSSYFVPSIAASGQGHVAIGATSAGKAEFCEVSVSGRLKGDPLNTLRAPAIAQSSSTAYNFSTSNPQRWGDFSFTCVDPNDNMTFWTFQEYCNASHSYAVQVIQLLAPKPATPASVNVSAVPVNTASQDVIITGTSVSGSGFYDPGSSFPNRLQVSIPGVTVNSIDYTTLTSTSVKVNISTVGSSVGTHDVTVTNPDGQFQTGSGILTVSGSPTCVVTPSGTSTNASPIVFTLTFSEAVTGLSTGGLSVTGGTIVTLSTLNPSTYTVSVTPSGQGAVTCQVMAGAAQAVSDGLANLASNVATVTYDTIPPSAPVILSPTNGTLTNNNLPTVSGTAEAGSTLTLRDGATIIGTTLTTGGGTWSLVPSGALADGVHTLSATATDAAGNVSPPSTGVSITVDTVRPTCVVTGPASPTNANPITFTLTFSKTVTGLTAGGITVTNGTKGGLLGTGTTYTIPVTPTADGTVTCQVTAGAAHDLAGNASVASNVASVTSDRTAPTCVVTGPASPTNASPIPFTLTFSETVTGLTAAGITVTNGTKGLLSGSGTTYTLPVTPTADGAVTCQVTAGAAQDLAGNPSVASNVGSVTSLRTPPTCVVAGPPSPTKNSPILFTLTFSNPVTGLTAAGITVTNGTKGLLSGSGTTYVMPVTPFADGTVTCQVVAAAAQDLAGNPNTASNVASVTSDRTPPTCVVSGPASPTNASPITFTLTFSETVVGLTAAGITVTNGAKGILSGVGTTYTIPVMPLADGAVTCQVTAGAAQDLAGNPSTASNVGSVTSDRTPPTCVVTGPASPTNANPIPFTLTFSKTVTGLTAAGITVTNGATGALSGSGTTYTIPVTPTANGTVTCQVMAAAAQDLAGNPNAASNVASVTSDRTPPTCVVSGPASPTNANSISFTLTFSKTVTGLTAAGIAVGNGTKGTLSGSGTTYTLPVTPSADGPVTCQVPAGAAQDLAGNSNIASNVGSVTSDRTPPTCVVSGPASPTNASTIVFTLTFSETVTGLTAAGITVTNGTKAAFTGTGTTYTISVTPTADGTVTCQVTAGAAQDLAGNPSTASNVGAVTSDRTPPGAPGTPSGTPTPNNTGTFTLSWTAASDGTGSGIASYTVQRSVNGGAYSTVATAVSGTSLAQNSLGQGSYRYQVQAVDNAGNTGPFSAPSAAVVVDTTAPHTTILLGPPKPSSSSGATFVFTSSQAGCTFQTSLDGAPFASNGTATTIIAYTGLANGAHTFQVRAVDSAGNVDPAPPSYAWTINTSGGIIQTPTTMLTGEPPNPTAQTTATFTFISSEAGGTFQVQLDGGGWISNGASGTKTYTALAKGSHTFMVRAIDTASNVDPAPPTYTWLIVAPPVDSTAPLLNLFSDDVSLFNWTVTGTDAAVTWAVDGTPASMIGGAFHSAPSSLNYNNGTDYDTPGVPNSGSATSPSIAISGLTGARLKFFCNYQTETLGTDHDVRTVQISNDGFTTFLVNETLSTTPGSSVALPCAAMGTWHEHIVPLTGLSGPIQVRFSFDTIDAGLNNFPGWFVDDFEISDLMVSELNQADGGSGSVLSVGGTTSTSSLNVTAVLSADSSGSVTLEVEVKPVGIPFTGTPTASAVGSGPGSAMSLSIPLPDGSYHWQARTVMGGVTSSWMSFGLNAETDPDLIIQTAPAKTAGGGGGGGGGGGCGSVGLDALLVLLGALSVRKRRGRSPG